VLHRPAPNPFFDQILVPQDLSSTIHRISVYAYDHWQVLDNLRLSAGLTYDRLHYPRNIDRSPIIKDEATKD